MTQVDITVSPDIADTIQSLEATSSQLQRAAIRALNKTARWLRTRITKETAEALNGIVNLTHLVHDNTHESL